MPVQNVILPLFSDPIYTYSISLEGNSYILEFIYNERAQQYFFNMYDSEKVLIFASLALVPSYPIAKDYVRDSLSGFFWLERKSELTDEPYKTYPDRLDQYYNFFYTYYTED